MKTLYEGILADMDSTMNSGDSYIGLNSFPKKTDFKKNEYLKGVRCTWLFPAFKNIYEKELKAYFDSSIGQSYLLPRYDEITGISVHIQKVTSNKSELSTGDFKIYVYIEGISRGSLTVVGTIIKDIEGERPTLVKAKEAAYNFLCQVRDDENFFKNILKNIVKTKNKYII